MPVKKSKKFNKTRKTRKIKKSKPMTLEQKKIWEEFNENQILENKRIAGIEIPPERTHADKVLQNILDEIKKHNKPVVIPETGTDWDKIDKLKFKKGFKLDPSWNYSEYEGDPVVVRNINRNRIDAEESEVNAYRIRNRLVDDVVDNVDNILRREVIRANEGNRAFNILSGNGNVENKSFKSNPRNFVGVEETLENKAIRQLKEHQILDKNFQQNIELEQMKNPEELNKILQLLPPDLQKRNFINMNKKIAEVAYRQQDQKEMAKTIKNHSPYLEQKMKEIRDIETDRHNMEESKYLLDKKYLSTSDDRKNKSMSSYQKMENEFLFKEANKQDPLQYTIFNNSLKNVYKRLDRQYIPTHSEVLNSARTIKYTTTKGTQAEQYINNMNKLEARITPQPSYYPSPMDLVMQSQLQAQYN